MGMPAHEEERDGPDPRGDRSRGGVVFAPGAQGPTEGSGTGEGGGTVEGSGTGEGGGDLERAESVQEPAKVMRIAIMARQLLDELRGTPLDQQSRGRLRAIYDQSLRELAGTLSPDLSHELAELAPPLDDATPTEAELRVAQAQLVGWLEGLFRGIQAAVFAQQMAAQAELERMRRQQVPGLGRRNDQLEMPATGTYL
jgi:hypothetical protein